MTDQRTDSGLERPPRLREGDRLAAVTLSWGGPGEFPHRYEAGKRQLEEAFGVTVVDMPHTLADPSSVADHPEARVDDLHAALADPGIAGIVSTIGGDDSIRLLRLVDQDLIAANPKVFLGYSDSTIVQMAFRRAGVVSFYGPAIMAGFGESGGLLPYMRDGVRRMVFGVEAPLDWPQNDDGWTAELLSWENPANQSRRRTLREAPGWLWLGGEMAEGPLVAGCLEVLDWNPRHRVVATTGRCGARDRDERGGALRGGRPALPPLPGGARRSRTDRGSFVRAARRGRAGAPGLREV